MDKIELSAEHIAAVNRERRLTIEHDRLFSTHDNPHNQWAHKNADQLDEVIAFYLGPLEQEWAENVNALFYTWGDGGGLSGRVSICPKTRMSTRNGGTPASIR